MTVFKTFWKIAKRYKGTILLYTVLLLVFGFLNLQSNDTSMDFVASKPDVYLAIEDEEVGLTKNFVDYIRSNMNVIDLDSSKEGIDDALFYRQVNYVIYIPKDYRLMVLRHENPSLQIKSTGDYQASLAEMMVERYLKAQQVLSSSFTNEDELIFQINESLGYTTDVVMTSTLDVNELSQVTQYFNFASYSLMAVIIFIICLVLSSFHETRVSQRILVGKMNYQKHNQYILGASFLYTLIVFAFFSGLAFVLFGDILLSLRGFLYLFNSFIFLFVALSIALLIANLVTNKEAVSGIVNVVALGSAFLCGAFVPVEWLPKSVLTIAHVLPSYWYIQSNELLKTTEYFEWSHLSPIFQNMLVLFLFGLFFLLFNQFVSRSKQRKNV